MGLYHYYANYLNSDIERGYKTCISDIQFQNISCSGENVVAIVGQDNNISDVSIDGIRYEKKDSKNRYLKGDRRIDVLPGKERIEFPDDGGEYWLYARGCVNLSVRNETVQDYCGKPLKKFVI